MTTKVEAGAQAPALTKTKKQEDQLTAMVTAIRRKIRWYQLRGLDIRAVFLHPDEPLPKREPYSDIPETNEETIWGRPVIRKDFVKRGTAFVHVSGAAEVTW